MDTPNDHIPLLPAINILPAIPIPVLDGNVYVHCENLQTGPPSVHHRPGGLTETIPKMVGKTNAGGEDNNDNIPSDTDDLDIPHAQSPHQKPCDLNWLTDEILEKLDQFKPTRRRNADESADPEEARLACDGAFSDPDFVWKNQYQLMQSVLYIGDMYGFTGKPSGYKIVCGCSLNHKQLKKKGSISPMGFVTPTTTKRANNKVSVL